MHDQWPCRFAAGKKVKRRQASQIRLEKQINHNSFSDNCRFLLVLNLTCSFHASEGFADWRGWAFTRARGTLSHSSGGTPWIFWPTGQLICLTLWRWARWVWVTVLGHGKAGTGRNCCDDKTLHGCVGSKSTDDLQCWKFQLLYQKIPLQTYSNCD